MSTAGWKPASPLALWEDSKYAAQVAALGLSVARLDDQLAGLTFAIATDPQQFDHVLGDVYVATTRNYPAAPRLYVVFSIDYNTGSCTLRWIDLV